ncbi:MAG: holo-ACP synthase [Fimbriimonadaceae bacterium]
MIVRIGIDVVEVERIARAMRRPGFLERILTPDERAVCRTPSKVAGRWAAKEAIAKAIGIHLSWQDVEILADDTRAPTAAVRSAKWNSQDQRIHISITHERHLAAAVAVLESFQ